MKLNDEPRIFLKICRKYALALVLVLVVSFTVGLAQTDNAANNAKRIPPPKHIVILLCDTLRWDYVSAYGTRKSLTPNIDALADEGLLFKNAHTVAPCSAPAYTTLFSAQFPFEHGVTNNAQLLPDDISYLPEDLHNLGFYTAAFVSNYYCSANFGFKRGFDTFKSLDEVGKHSWTIAKKLLPWLERWKPDKQPLFLFVSYMDLHEPYSLPYAPHWLRIRLDDRIVSESSCPDLQTIQRMQLSLSPGIHKLTFERILPPLREGWKPKYRFTPYSWSSLLKAGVEIELTGNVNNRKEDVRAGTVSWTSTGFPVIATLKNPTDKTISGELVMQLFRRYNVEEIQTIYPRSIEFLDHEIGRVINALRKKGVLDDTLIILLSDHGEGLGDHGLKGHIEQLYDSLMHVPLIMRYPPFGKGVTIDELVSIIDLSPTILDSLGKSPPPGYSQSLLQTIRDGSPPGRQWVLAETSPPEAAKRLTCLRTPTTKLIVNHTNKRIEFYDLVSDPSESKNQYSDSSPRVLKAIKDYCDLFNLSNPFDELSSVEVLDLNSLSPEEIRKLKSLGYLK